MINEVNQVTVPMALSKAAQNAYEKFKRMVLRIFALLKRDDFEENLKEEFYDSYINFARKLDDDGHFKESNLYMSICRMYFCLIDKPKELIEYECFFTDLFNAFEDLLFVKINDNSKYDEKLEEFIQYSGEMQEFFYAHLAKPSVY